MPLNHSSSDAAFKQNVSTLMGEVGKSPHVQSRDQALAIAFATKRRGRAPGGFTQGSSWQERSAARQLMHSGPVMSAVPGRTDRHPITVPSGSYVLPADHVSALGQNNTVAGFKILGSMFPKSSLRRGPGPPKPPSLPGGLNTAMGRRQSGLTSDQGGARGNDHGEPTDIIVAGGEFGILPEEVAAAGGGDLKKGHAALDKWVLNTRKKHISTLKGLPPPAKS